MMYRGESEAPAKLATKLLPIEPKGRRRRRQLNYGAHFAVGAGWGATHSLVERGGLRGQSAVAAVFGLMWTGDVLMMAPSASTILRGAGRGRTCHRRGGQARAGRGDRLIYDRLTPS